MAERWEAVGGARWFTGRVEEGKGWGERAGARAMVGSSRGAGGGGPGRARAWVVGLVLAVVGCGYQPAYGGAQARYDVVAARYSTASFEAVPSVLAGARSELGAAKALGDGYPRVVVEVLRVDERSIGVRSTGNDTTPLARGSEITVVGRAQVRLSADAEPSFDTGDMSRTAPYAAGATPSADAASRSRAVRDAARALGVALGRSILGLPEPAEG